MHFPWKTGIPRTLGMQQGRHAVAACAVCLCSVSGAQHLRAKVAMGNSRQAGSSPAARVIVGRTRGQRLSQDGSRETWHGQSAVGLCLGQKAVATIELGDAQAVVQGSAHRDVLGEVLLALTGGLYAADDGCQLRLAVGPQVCVHARLG